MKDKMMDKEQFCRRIREQETSMYRYALGVLRNSADAEDAVGETVLKAYAHLAQLKNPERFRSWAMSILVNVTRTMLAGRGRLELPGDMSLYEQRYAVMDLPQDFRQAVILYYYEGFRTKEIARMMNLSEGTVKSRLNRARQKLKTALEGKNG